MPTPHKQAQNLLLNTLLKQNQQSVHREPQGHLEPLAPLALLGLLAQV
jgi:hypothetical protein